MGAENTEKRVILLRNGAKFILDKEPFRVILPSPEAKNDVFRKIWEKFEEKL